MTESTKTEVLSRLRDLHQELAGINEQMKSCDRIDEPTIDALADLLGDVGVLIDQAKSTNKPEGAEDLSDQVRKFECEHPRVTEFLRQLTDVLGMMGV